MTKKPVTTKAPAEQVVYPNTSSLRAVYRLRFEEDSCKYENLVANSETRI